jgi:Fe-S cluster assembly protein SufD
MSIEAGTLERYQSLVERELAARAGGGPEWLDARRRAAADRAREVGLPHRKQEAWKYTSVEPLLQHAFVPAETRGTRLSEADLAPHLLEETAGGRIVFVNGRFEPGLSALDGAGAAQVVSLAEALSGDAQGAVQLLGSLTGAGEHVFAALNTAAMEDGALVRIPEGVSLEQPLEILHLSVASADPQVVQPRNLIVVEPGARARLVERFVSVGQPLYFNNVVDEILLGESAVLEHERLQTESPNAFHMAGLHVDQAGGSRYRCVTAALGAGWARTEVRVRFRAPGAECEVDGLYLAGDGQLVDFHLDVDHDVPGCTSRENFRGILDGRGRAVFDGRVLVQKQAQKTAAHLANANLMLSRNAEIDTKPQLEIFADDVQCSHGTTVGQLDPEALFYLRSRGLSETVARKMLSLGFAGAILERYLTDGVRRQADAVLQARLESASESAGA